MRKIAVLARGVVCAVLAMSSVGAAAGADDRVDEMLDMMRRKGQLTDREYESLKSKGDESATKSPRDFRVYWKEGVRFETADKAFVLKLGGRIQSDFAVVALDRPLADELSLATTQNGVEFRRARLEMSGTVYKNFEFKAQYDFADGDPAFKDVYLGVINIPFVQRVLVGHFREPYSLEEQTSSVDITFMERSLGNMFSPARNTGIGILQAYLEDRLTFAIGGFHDADDFGKGFGKQEDYNLTTRLTGLPLYQDDGRTLVHLGFAYTHRFRGDDIRFRQRPESHLADRLIDTGSFHASDVDIISPEFALVLGPFSAQAEYEHVFVQSNPTNDPNFYAFYLQASYFLTGEHRPFKAEDAKFERVVPNHNLFDGNGGWGAWELAARFSRADLSDGGVHGGKMNDVTAGINWYMNPNFRLTFNYVFADRESAGDAHIAQGRFQVAF